MFVKEETRKLARIVTVDAIKPIPKADLLEIAVVGGWECIVLKDQYKPGDLALYFEIDASIPVDSPAWGDFDMKRMLIRTDSDTKRQYVVIKSIRLRGVLSQGLLLTVDHLNYLGLVGLQDGLNLTDNLEALKYVSPEEWKLYQARLREASGEGQRGTNSLWWKLRMWLVKGILIDGLQPWPEGHVKSDEERVQNLGKQYDKWVAEGDTYEATIKLDGESTTVYQDLATKRPGVAQRNFSLRTEDVPYTFKESLLVYIAAWMRFIPRRLRGGACPFPTWLKAYSAEGVPLVRMMKKLGIIDRLQDFNHYNDLPFTAGKIVAIQGEMVGPNFNRNAEGLKDNAFYMYRAYGNGSYEFPPEEARQIAAALKVNYIPVVDANLKLPAELKDLLKMADGPGHFDPKRKREGLVIKNNRTGQSAKVISNAWLEKKDKEEAALEQALAETAM
ncbi:hypothetical protein [Burkholderia phage FLC9]|nr:hypothetical protein [Burkholderia phage FLC9]